MILRKIKPLKYDWWFYKDSKVEMEFKEFDRGLNPPKPSFN